MEKIYQNLLKSIKHLNTLHTVFSKESNYTDNSDYVLYIQNLERVEEISEKIGFDEEQYSKSNRQMKLADIVEYIFFSRGIFALINGKNQLKIADVPKFIELILRFVNMLMLYEIMTTDVKMRKAFLNQLKEEIHQIGEESEFNKLLQWDRWVGLAKGENPEGAPSAYFDTILPKTAGGLWHEMLVYAFILRFDIGYIFPLLLHQKIISLNKKLSPPDLIILHKKTDRYYGIEIGGLKERQSGGFMAPSGIPVIPLDTLNCRASDRCPVCKKWIGICPKIIKEFSNPEHTIGRVEIRCLYNCDEYSLNEKIEGKCPYMKFYDKLHHHYKCVVHSIRQDIISDIIKKHKLNTVDFEIMLENREISNLPYDGNNIRSKKINYLITHYPWYPELSKLI